MLGPGPITAMARRAEMKDFSYNSVWGLSRAEPARPGALLPALGPLDPERHERYARYLLKTSSPQRWGVAEARPKGWRPLLQGRLGRRHRTGEPPDRAL